MWDIKHRPLRFSDVLGQEGTVLLLKARLKQGTALDTNYIFAGGYGQGKTTLARILARAMLCLDLDPKDPEPCNVCDNCQGILAGQASAFVEQDAASGGTIDAIRAIVEDLPFAVFNAPKRVYVFDEAHRMSRDAQDVLLKPLEEKRMVGIFCTTEAEKIRGTIRSRCEPYTIRRVTREDMLVRANKILDAEGVPHEDDAVLTVIDFCGGHIRDVVNKLEMVSQMGAVNIEYVREYLHLSTVGLFFEILLALGTPQKSVELIEQACERVSPEEVASGLAEAAMNSFRLAHGMFAEFTYVDKELAQKVYSVYGDQTVKLAEFFLRARFTSKVGLICDVLSLQGGVTTVVAPTVAVPIQIVAAPAAPVPAAPVPTTPAASSAPSSVVPAALPSPAAPSPLPVTPSPSPSVPQAPPPAVVSAVVAGRGDGIGNLGGSDIAALTEVDEHGVRKAHPRRRHNPPQTLVYSNSKSLDLLEILTPDQWAREFEMSWKALTGRG